MKEKDIVKLMDKLTKAIESSGNIFRVDLLWTDLENISIRNLRILEAKELIELNKIQNDYSIVITSKGFAYKTLIREKKWETFQNVVTLPLTAKLSYSIIGIVIGWLAKEFI
ncbi:hypothetical protein [Oenococcus oeni]|uniref:hypothetical protein n=1 Tax=Oenococcus oeni TaxID=1247 RepID=UPI0010AEF4A3|nr:hypothetical protein [Oenococcus oeni]SYW16226.1 hypothetical protein OENI_30058 [Oenococcus oeni]SYW19507.1 hypothetical protein OENI_160055 [Oenococcus oeni]